MVLEFNYILIIIGIHIYCTYSFYILYKLNIKIQKILILLNKLDNKLDFSNIDILIDKDIDLILSSQELNSSNCIHSNNDYLYNKCYMLDDKKYHIL